jgi:MFS family permease
VTTDIGLLAEAEEALHQSRENPPVDLTPPPNPLYAWYMMAALLVCSILSSMDRQIMSLLIEPMKHDLKFSDTEISLLHGFAVAVFYATMGIPIGRIVDSRRRMSVVAGGVALWSAMTALCGTVQSFWHLFLCRMGVGVGDAALSPSAYSLISDCFDAKRLGFAMAVFTTGLSLGSGIALLIGSEILHFLEGMNGITLPLLGPVYSWQLVFLVVGLPGVFIALWIMTIREPKRRGNLRIRQLPDGSSAYAGVTLKETFAYIRQNARTFVCMNIAISFIAVHGYGSGAWIPTFLIRSHGYTAVEAGRSVGLIVAFSGTIGVLAGGLLGDWFVKRGMRNGRLIALGLVGIFTAPFTFIYPIVDSATLALWLLVPTYFFTSFASASWSASLAEMMPNQMRGVAVAIGYLMLNLLGAGCGPTMIAAMTDYVFKDELSLRYSLQIVVTGVMLTSTVFAFIAAGSWNRTLDNLSDWGKAHNNPGSDRKAL